jgi:hypothetical protein
MVKRKRRVDVPFLLVTPPEEIVVACRIIQKFITINNIKLRNDLVIKIDFSLPSEYCGLYFYKKDEFSIYIDPQNCTTAENYEYGLVDKEYSYFGYACDLTMIGVTLHEFSHFLAHQVFKDIFSEYKKKFPTKRIFLNHYSSTDAEEELTEVMRLYIHNPIFLRLIDRDVYRFVRKWFKSPSPCSDKQFYKFYKDYPEAIKTHLKDKWKIVYNIQTKKFERV